MTEQEYGRTVTRELDTLFQRGQESMSDRWESFTQAFIDVIQDARVFIDCGVEYGFYLRIALKYGRSNLRIIAIEADPVRYALLAESFNDPRVKLIHAAVGAGQGSTQLCRARTGYSASTSLARSNSDGETFEVPMNSLDDFVTKADVVKLDIEGDEDLAVQGMRRLLRECRPELFIEFHPPMKDADRKQTIKTLRSFGYVMSEETEQQVMFCGRVHLCVE